MSDFAGILRQGLGSMGITLQNEAQVLERLLVYQRELVKWNRKINLVSREASEQQLAESHFLDSLTLVPLLADAAAVDPGRPMALLDIGSGAGFPALVLKTAWPALAVTLVEPRQKRVFFLKQVIRLLQLEGVEVLDCRLEKRPGPEALAGRRFDWLTSRAFTSLASFVELAEPYSGPAGRIIAMKGPQAVEELAVYRKSASAAEFVLERQLEFRLPFSGADRRLLVLRRSGQSERPKCM